MDELVFGKPNGIHDYQISTYGKFFPMGLSVVWTNSQFSPFIHLDDLIANVTNS